jgi:hypothetical protein
MGNDTYDHDNAFTTSGIGSSFSQQYGWDAA